MGKKFSAISTAKAIGLHRCRQYSCPFATKWNNYRTSAEFTGTEKEIAAFIKAMADAGIVEHATIKGRYDLPEEKWVDIRFTTVSVRAPKQAAHYSGSIYD